jgi:hypothetical protein
MLKLSFKASLVSFIVYLILAFFIWHSKDVYSLYNAAIELIFYSLPLFFVSLALLWFFNSSLKRFRFTIKNWIVYIICAFSITIVVYFSYVLQDYLQGGRFPPDSYFLNIAIRYLGIIYYSVLLFALNYYCIWNSGHFRTK